MTPVEINGLPYIAIGIDRLMRILESNSETPSRFFCGHTTIPVDAEFRILCETELSELMEKYQRMTAYIEGMSDSWTKEIFYQRFIERKSFRELSSYTGLPSGTIKQEIYSYIRHHPEGYVTSKELAKKWRLNINTINAYCRKGFLLGSFKENHRQRWLIPENSSRPQLATPHYRAPKIPAEFVNTAELAQELGVSTGMISKRCKRGDFPGASKFNHGIWIIPRRYMQTKKQS